VALSLAAPAKVNLGLRVLGRRADGYHELDTCMHALELADTIAVEAAGPGIGLLWRNEARTGLPVAGGSDNLVHRAAAAFCGAAGVEPAFRFLIHKRVPAGAGLGGGSSDAASTLLLLNALCREVLDFRTLVTVATALGADVPFFLRAGTQRATGIGEVLAPVSPAPHYHFVLVMPPFGTSTPEVYKNWSGRLTDGEDMANIPMPWALAHQRPADRTGFVNDLESAVMSLYPGMMQLRDRMHDRGHPEVNLSGSGSTLYLAFARRSAALQAAADLRVLEDDGVAIAVTESATRANDRRPQSVEFAKVAAGASALQSDLLGPGEMA